MNFFFGKKYVNKLYIEIERGKKKHAQLYLISRLKIQISFDVPLSI